MHNWLRGSPVQNLLYGFFGLTSLFFNQHLFSRAGTKRRLANGYNFDYRLYLIIDYESKICGTNY